MKENSRYLTNIRRGLIILLIFFGFYQIFVSFFFQSQTKGRCSPNISLSNDTLRKKKKDFFLLSFQCDFILYWNVYKAMKSRPQKESYPLLIIFTVQFFVFCYFFLRFIHPHHSILSRININLTGFLIIGYVGTRMTNMSRQGKTNRTIQQTYILYL